MRGHRAYGLKALDLLREGEGNVRLSLRRFRLRPWLSVMLGCLLFWQGTGVIAQGAGDARTQAEPHAEAVDRWYFNEDLLVGKGQRVRNVTCVFCSAQIEGEVSGRMLVLFGNASVTGRIGGSATVVGGNAVFDEQARVLGRTTVLFGNAVYESEEVLPGSVYVLGGHASSFAARESLRRHVTLSPRLISTLVLLGLTLLLALGIITRTRRQTA